MWHKKASDEQEPLAYIGIWYAVYSSNDSPIGYQISHEHPRLNMDILDHVKDELVENLLEQDADRVFEEDSTGFNLARYEAQSHHSSSP